MSPSSPMQDPTILLCTLGASWAVIPEIYGWLAPEKLDLYRHHPQRINLDTLRHEHQLRAPNELWIMTTSGAKTQESLAQMHLWLSNLPQALPVRIWVAKKTDQLASQQECDEFKELILRVTLLAKETVGEHGQLLLSLAGGRKTMSADLQSAGAILGAHAWLHVVGPEPLPEPLRTANPILFTAPLTPELAAGVTPLIAGRGNHDELLSIPIDGHIVNSKAYPIALPGLNQTFIWQLPTTGAALSIEIAQRQRQGQQLFGNFLRTLAEQEHHENWRSLYRLPPDHIESLRTTQLNIEHRNWLHNLPKADLHRHLGGTLDLQAQRQIGQIVWQSLSATERNQALDHVAPLLNSHQPWPWSWAMQLRQGNRPANTAALLCHANDGMLNKNLWGATEPRLGLKQHHPQGFSAYERPGELTGSAILSHPAAIEPYAQALLQQAIREGLSYIELRGSPQKYRPEDPVAFLVELKQALQRASAALTEPPIIGFLWILDRRQAPNQIAEVVKKAIISRNRLDGFLLGLDLAGDEGGTTPEQLVPAFAPAFRDCLPITIHAGEGESAENIWQAAYLLNADRIGHGLTLVEHPTLAARFRDRGISLELCPTSNREVVGFHDPLYPLSQDMPAYPIRQLLEMGLSISIATDNPGISRTTLADEYLAAARMSNGISQWETLSMIRQGFVRAFLPSAQREKLLKRVDAQLFTQLLEKNQMQTHPQHT